MTQCERLKQYLIEHKKINPMQAWQELGIYRLGARVFDLKHKEGLNIVTDTVNVQNRFGEDCHVAQYELIE